MLCCPSKQPCSTLRPAMHSPNPLFPMLRIVQAAGLAPLAAVYGAVWGGPKGAFEGAVADWQRELAAVAGMGGSGPLLVTPPKA